MTEPIVRHGTSPLVEHLLDSVDSGGGGYQEHSFLGLGEHDLIPIHAVFPAVHLGYVQMDPAAGPGRRFHRGTGKAGSAQVLDSLHRPGGQGLPGMASMSTFSRNGLATCTVGRSSCSSSKVREARPEAPWIPSRPVPAPTSSKTLPASPTDAVAIWSTGTRPTHMALTRGFWE